MTKRYTTVLILSSLLAIAAPASAHCANQGSASSITRSCESGVTVFRGQQNGPDFRFAKLAQERDIAEAKVREAHALAQMAQRQSANITVNQNSSAVSSGGFGGFGGFGVNG